MELKSSAVFFGDNLKPLHDIGASAVLDMVNERFKCSNADNSIAVYEIERRSMHYYNINVLIKTTFEFNTLVFGMLEYTLWVEDKSIDDMLAKYANYGFGVSEFSAEKLLKLKAFYLENAQGKQVACF